MTELDPATPRPSGTRADAPPRTDVALRPVVAEDADFLWTWIHGAEDPSGSGGTPPTSTPRTRPPRRAARTSTPTTRAGASATLTSGSSRWTAPPSVS